MTLMQIRNSEMVDLLSADFQHRNEPNFAWKSACSAFLALPGLRGFWPMSSVNYQATDRAIDVGGQGNHLTANGSGNINFGFDNLAPYARFVSANSQYLNRADGGAANWSDITGTETYIITPGLTFIAWIYFAGAAAANEYVMAKRSAASISYWMLRTAAGLLQFAVNDGISSFAVADGSLSGTTWYFVAGRFVPANEIKIWINDDTYTSIASPVASIQDTAQNFTLGSRSDGAAYFNGRQSMVALCASALSDAIIGQLYHQTRTMYGV